MGRRVGLSVMPLETRREVLAANAPKFAGLVPEDAEELLEELAVYGTPSEARRRLERWFEAGADFPVLLLGPKLTPRDRALTLETFRPMLRGAGSSPC